MAEINIGGDPNDRSYRYKRPRCTTKIEGRGNGIKTVIPNILDVAKALNITPSYPTKFFGIELGAQSKYDEVREVAVVNGSHDTSVIESVLEKFIDTYVLCPSAACRLPEIRLKVKKGQIRADCAACGNQATVGDTHKLTVYIIKNPPTKSKKDKSDKDKDKKKEKRVKKSKEEDREKASEAVDQASATPEQAPEVWYTDTSAAAAQARIQEDRALNGDKAADIDKLIESVQLNQSLAANASAEEILKSFVAGGDRSDQEIASEVRRLELSRALTQSQKIHALLVGVLDTSDPRTLPQQIKKRATLLRHYAKNRTESQILFGGFEQLICSDPTALIPRTAFILQSLYDNDIVAEDILIDWYDSSVSSSSGVSEFDRDEMRQHGKKFIDWLKAADSDDNDCEDDDGEE